MLWAITPRGIGKPVSFRAIAVGMPLAQGEFISESEPEGKVLAEDGASLRAVTSAEALRDRREARKEYVNVERQADLNSRLVVSWSDAVWQATEADINRLSGAIASFRQFQDAGMKDLLPDGTEVPTHITWRDNDNVNHNLTDGEASVLLAMMQLALQAVFFKSWTLKNQIDASDDPESISW